MYKNKMKTQKMTIGRLALLLVLLMTQAVTAGAVNQEVWQKLKNLPGITDVDTLASTQYADKFVMYIDQLLDRSIRKQEVSNSASSWHTRDTTVPPFWLQRDMTPTMR